MANTNATAGTAAASAGTAVGNDTFGAITSAELDAADATALDALSFGVVGLDASGRTQAYNTYESQLAGLSRESVLNEEFFLIIGVCMNNYLVAQRFEDEPTLDATLDYVLTFRMRPTPVKLRLLQQPGSRLHYILVRR